ncbi:hypothetical protein ACFLQ6_07600 [Thermoproteota archaeon]
MDFKKLTNSFLISILLLIVLIPSASALTLDDSEVFILEAPENTVYFIYSDTIKNSKPLRVTVASPIDWTATGYIKGITRYTQIEGLDTDNALVDQSSGAPKFGDKAVVLSGGPFVQVLVKYYESNRIAPVYFEAENDMYYWYCRNGSRIDVTGLIPNSQNDMFVVEHFLDSDGNAVLIIYGYGGSGTFAGAKFYKTVIHPNIRDYTHSYYIYQWLDMNNDYFPDLNEIDPNPVAYGD